MMRILSFLLLAAPAFASGGGHGEEHGGGHAGIPWATLIFSTINILIFLYILARFAAPAVSTWVRNRRDEVMRDLEEAAKLRGEAQRLKDEWETRIAGLEGEIATLRKQAQEDIVRERERILASARANAEKMKRDAERIANAEARHLELQLRGEAVRKAISIAEDKIRSDWSAQDQDRSVADFLQQVQA